MKLYYAYGFGLSLFSSMCLLHGSAFPWPKVAENWPRMGGLQAPLPGNPKDFRLLRLGEDHVHGSTGGTAFGPIPKV